MVRGALRTPASRPVLLWPDTFNNYFHPQIAQAAVEVLEAAGFQVAIPAKIALLRPAALRLRHARHWHGASSGRSSTRLTTEIAAGMPVVGLEPSCVAVFRDELINLFPMDEDARRLSAQTFTLSRVPRPRRPGLRAAQGFAARRSCTATATTTR